ncbi:NAD-dependent succinate-semialdehyde dehydrogenase [Cardiobacteriaceae bacterium TAE3-ERU3]|nr:NAD-dependent succinate-semialdehyde dehydrogenase [Cardiobacteriaceae bacterium TAE3-ERU3]
MSTYQVKNPNTGEKGEVYPSLNSAEIERAIEQAEAAYVELNKQSIAERAAVLKKAGDLYDERAEELAHIIGREMGKPLKAAIGEIKLVADIYRWYAEKGPELLENESLPLHGADKSFVEYRPIGALLGIMPWNYPYYQVARFAAPNLLLGNTILLKHAQICPESSMACEQILTDAGLLQHAFQSVFVEVEDVESIIADKRIKGVSLTGSERAGTAVAAQAAKHIKKSVLELGGNDPMVVLDTDDVAGVAKAAVRNRLSNSGQVCTSNKRIIVLESLYDEFVKHAVEFTKNTKVGTYDDPETKMGPLSSVGARDEVVERIQKAVKDGATLHCGGEKLDRAGAFMSPAVLTDIPEGSDLACNELFGPAVMIYKAKDDAHAIEIANDTDFGLSASVWGADVARATKVADQLNAGMIAVNEFSSTQPDLPFGGIKRSGYGRELGKWGLFEFANVCLRRISEQKSS